MASYGASLGKMHSRDAVTIDPRELKWLIEHFPDRLYVDGKAGLAKIGTGLLGETHRSIEGRGSPRKLGSRSGRLYRSFKMRLAGKSLKSLRVEVYSRSKYAAIHEFGGTIKARSGGYLKIPLGAALNDRGLVKRTRGMWENTELKPAGPMRFLVVPKGGGTPLALLVKAVKLPPRLGFYRRFQDRRVKIASEMAETIAGTVRRANNAHL